MPYYTMHASQFFYLTDEEKEQVQKYLKHHGINPNTTEQFTVDGDLRGIALIAYVVNDMGLALLDENSVPITEQEWIPLKDGEGPPPFLHKMVRGDMTSNGFTGSNVLLDSKGNVISS